MMYPPIFAILTAGVAGTLGGVFIVGAFSQNIINVKPVCGDHATQEHIRTLMREAVDATFKEHIGHLHLTWMRDTRDQPGRAATGVMRGVTAYIHARNAVAEWSLKPC